MKTTNVVQHLLVFSLPILFYFIFYHSSNFASIQSINNFEATQTGVKVIYVEFPEMGSSNVGVSREIYRASMAQHFTLYYFQISRRCENVEKWYVNADEFNNYYEGSTVHSGENGNGGNTSQVIITDPDNPANPPGTFVYANCFN